MGFFDAINSAGEWVEDAAEESVEWLGDRTEDGLRWSGDRVSDLGWDSGGEALHEAADEVASFTGAELNERELGQTEDPKELIRGEPSAIVDKSTTLTEMGEGIGSTGEALAAIKVNDWAGDGAEAFEAVYSQQPGLWSEAATAFESASGAYETFAGVLKAQQGKARQAIAKWKQAEKLEKMHAAKSSEDKASSTLDEKAAALKEEAQQILRAARIERDNAAGVASGELAAAAATAPQEPPFLTRMAQNVQDLQAVGTQWGLSFVEGATTAVSGTVAFIRSVNPTDTYNLTHPAEYMSSMSDLGTGIVSAAADPGAVVDAMVNEAKEDPFKFLGSLAPDAALAAMTGGGSVPLRAVRTLEKVSDLAPTNRPSTGGGTPSTGGTPAPRPDTPGTPNNPGARPDSPTPTNTDTSTGADQPRPAGPDNGPGPSP
ncbi:putative T7SS-secreted protein, partial [Dietzia sp. NCCP-2495]|uniref:putative T7SS-secreted protein n=1 Tax=Dietzia sp. NCCP-2495 TaxID=2934675 RepID=UPI0035CCFA0E